MNIGRNEPCFCGSGKKFKKCCIEKDSNNINDFSNLSFREFLEKKKDIPNKKKVSAKTFFEQYNTVDLLTIIGLLKVLPENHGKNLRLEEIQKQVILANNNNENLINISSLKDFIH